MARHLDPRTLSGGLVRKDLVFSLAGEKDEPDLRKLLRENRLGGRYQITLEREPNAFRADFELAEFQAFIIARSGVTGEPIGLCEKVVWPSVVNGKEVLLPYIGALRVSEKYRNRITVLKGGFEALRTFARHEGELPFALTSITSDNAVAQRILTANLPGHPAYYPVGGFSTFVMRTRLARTDGSISAAADADLPEIAAFLCKNNSAFQFSFAWTKAALRSLGAYGLRPEQFLLCRSGGRLLGCLAVWDQRAFRQTVIRVYPSALTKLRPITNLAAPLAGLPRLPKIGDAVNQAMLSHLAVENDNPDVFRALLSAGLSEAKFRGIDAASIGFATLRGLRETLLKSRRAIEYRTSLYLAHWPDAADAVAAFTNGIPHPEMALL